MHDDAVIILSVPISGHQMLPSPIKLPPTEIDQSPVPLYVQLSELLEQHMASGRWDRFSSNRSLVTGTCAASTAFRRGCEPTEYASTRQRRRRSSRLSYTPTKRRPRCPSGAGGRQL